MTGREEMLSGMMDDEPSPFTVEAEGEAVAFFDGSKSDIELMLRQVDEKLAADEVFQAALAEDPADSYVTPENLAQANALFDVMDPVSRDVLALWNRHGGWIPGAMWAELAAALRIDPVLTKRAGLARSDWPLTP